MKKALFYTFLVLFMVTFLATILGITKALLIDECYLKPLFAALLLELVGGVIGLYKTTKFFTPEHDTQTESEEGRRRQAAGESPKSPAIKHPLEHLKVPMISVILRKASTDFDLALLEGYWLSYFDYASDAVSTNDGKGEQCNIELLHIDEGKLRGDNIFLVNTNTDRKYYHTISALVCESHFLAGSWENTTSSDWGLFELHIHPYRKRMVGKWLGSTSKNNIEAGKWVWIKIDQPPEQFADTIKRYKDKTWHDVGLKLKALLSGESVNPDDILRIFEY